MRILFISENYILTATFNSLAIHAQFWRLGEILPAVMAVGQVLHTCIVWQLITFVSTSGDVVT